MTRPKMKDSEARSFRIRKDLGERLDEYSETSHIPKTVIVELALEEYLKYNTLLYATPIRAQTVANGLNERFDTDEFVVVPVELTNTAVQHGYTVVSTSTM